MVRVVSEYGRRHVSAEPSSGGSMRYHVSFGTTSSGGNRQDDGYLGTNRADGHHTSISVLAGGSVRSYLSSMVVIVKTLIGIDPVVCGHDQVFGFVHGVLIRLRSAQNPET